MMNLQSRAMDAIMRKRRYISLSDTPYKESISVIVQKAWKKISMARQGIVRTFQLQEIF